MDDLPELLVFFRYEIDLAQLARFEANANRHWVRDPPRDWR
jgi:hypothetical protein